MALKIKSIQAPVVVVKGKEIEFTYDQTTATISKKLGLAALRRRHELVMVEIHFSAAPTTSESFTITKNSHLGSQNKEYDTVVFSQNPSSPSATNIVNIWDKPYPLEVLDDLTVAYGNTDTNMVAFRVVVRRKP